MSLITKYCIVGQSALREHIVAEMVEYGNHDGTPMPAYHPPPPPPPPAPPAPPLHPDEVAAHAGWMEARISMKELLIIIESKRREMKNGEMDDYVAATEENCFWVKPIATLLLHIQGLISCDSPEASVSDLSLLVAEIKEAQLLFPPDEVEEKEEVEDEDEDEDTDGVEAKEEEPERAMTKHEETYMVTHHTF